MLERFKQMSMWSDGRQMARQMAVKRPSMLILSVISFLFQALLILFGR